MTSRSSTFRTLGLAAATALVGSLTASTAIAAPERPDRAPAVQKKAAAKPVALPDDFNGDGYQDIALSAPMAYISGERRAGYVTVMYGSKSKTPTANKQILHQDSPGIPDKAENGDQYGRDLATGDLDHDGYTDLIVGARYEDTAAGKERGNLSVVWGGKSGLSGSAILRDGSGAHASGGDFFVTGDFDGDGDTDLADTNSPGLRVFAGPFSRDGVPTGVTDHGKLPWGDTKGISSGDVDGDGKTDVVATVRDWYTTRSGPWSYSGHTVVWKGTAQGPADPVEVTGVAGQPLSGDALDIGDINRDGFEDLVVGRTEEYDDNIDELAIAKGGMITYVPGSAKGLDSASVTAVNQDSHGVPGEAESGDRFGQSISIADIDGDEYEDLAIGVPVESLGVRQGSAGAVVTMRGGSNGPMGETARVLTQNTADVPGSAEEYDQFGLAVKLADTNADGRAELFASAPRENKYEGSVWIFQPTATGITAKKSVVFGPKSLGQRPDISELGFTYNN
ncbi:hypothetical protein GCM10010387_58920 [Streptomyces inusitatus]|uniref:Integrin-like protein n=1 Tax=Streptomyces inusitatus TaxID=68221 RepID=A0A918QLE1_9ACTN|nr:FG-GAP-like repeat-containing protein [Streptomyces inusitatus]GGZ57202.1 hypothetical protein GCM10010387_58920 [Streptomyces inusitatus]